MAVVPADTQPPPKLCGARNRRHPGTCKRTRGWGTEHPGYGHCKYHGGNTITGRRFAAREAAMAEMPFFGGEIEIEPQDALLACIRREAGRAVWLRLRVEMYEEEHAEDGDTSKREDALAYAHLEAQATDRLARFSKMALDAGVAERRVRIAERAGQSLAQALETALADFVPLTVAQKADLVRRFATQLALIEAHGDEAITEADVVE